ncbi:MAG: hypothetical protein AB7U49_16015 [Hyphomicrobiaceae bacterium]
MLLPVALLMLISVPGAAAADTSGSHLKIALAQTALPSAGAARMQSRPLVQQAAGYACRSCRRACYYEYRIDCWGAWCRKAFTSCMRSCWYEICR